MSHWHGFVVNWHCHHRHRFVDVAERCPDARLEGAYAGVWPRVETCECSIEDARRLAWEQHYDRMEQA